MLFIETNRKSIFKILFLCYFYIFQDIWKIVNPLNLKKYFLVIKAINYIWILVWCLCVCCLLCMTVVYAKVSVNVLRTTQILGVLKFIMQSSNTSANICALLCYRIIYPVQSSDTRKKPWIFKIRRRDLLHTFRFRYLFGKDELLLLISRMNNLFFNAEPLCYQV